MKLNTLDLHGIRHYEVDLMVENYVYLNQDDMPLKIICGNSQKMHALVLVMVILDHAPPLATS